MIDCILLERTGNITQIQIDENDIINNYFGCIYDDTLEINEQAIYDAQINITYKIYGSNNNYLLKENKHELMPPYETSIFYGDLLLIKYVADFPVNIEMDDIFFTNFLI